MDRLSHYLYKYPRSQNFYFRVRIPNQIIQKFSLENQFFIGSLRTPDVNVAQRLALFLKPLIFKECCMMEDYSEAMEIIREMREKQANEDMQGEKWDFRKYLKERFDEYLAWGKQAIASENTITESIEDLPIISNQDANTFGEYLKHHQTKYGFTGNTELLAQKDYLYSFINDFAAFTRTYKYKFAKTDTDSELSLDKATAAEKLFSEFGYGESYAKAFPTDCNSQINLETSLGSFS